MKVLSVIITTVLFLSLNGCSHIIDATSDGPVNNDPGKRTWGAAIDDEQIETLVLVNLKKASPSLDDAHINVTSYNAVVLLTGQVASNELRELAGRTAADINRTRQVYNELQVQGNTSVLDRTNDTWLTSKVKAKLLANQDINGGRIKVTSENGTVFLMGLLTRTEADKAISVIQNTGGVQKVVKVFEYID